MPTSHVVCIYILFTYALDVYEDLISSFSSRVRHQLVISTAAAWHGCGRARNLMT